MGRLSDQRKRRAHVEGYKAGVLSCLAFLNDVHDFTNEELQEVADNALVFIKGITDGTVEVKYVNREMEKMTGINVLEALDEI